MTGLAVPLLVLGGILLVAAMGTVLLAPLLATRAAAVSAKPRLERRASGPDRMRALITAQRTERTRSRGLSSALTRTGMILGVLSILSLAGGVAAWATGY